MNTLNQDQEGQSIMFNQDFYVQEDITIVQQQQLTIDERLANTINSSKSLYGKLTPFTLFGMQLYRNPQAGMLIYTLLLTLTIQTVMLYFVFFGVHFYVGIVLCLYIIYLLLSLGFSDPGFAHLVLEKRENYSQTLAVQTNQHQNTIATPHTHIITPTNQELNYFCRKCKIAVGSKTRHCQFCDVCVTEYDHHCVFIGKCVGSNNLRKFYTFLIMIFATILYGLISTLLNLSNIKKAHPHNL